VVREHLLELLAVPEPRPVAAPLADLTTKEAALILQRSPVTVRTWCEKGRCPGAYVYAGKEWRLPRASVDALRAALQGGRLPPIVRREPETIDLSAHRCIGVPDKKAS
jgi:excisionase family DNA binding protein